MKLLVILSMIAVATASDVLELGDSNFKDTLEDFDLALVKFYAPWCGHCKKMAPEFDKASSILKDNDPPVHLVKVDCTSDGKETCSQFSVSGYPTVKIFKGGEFSEDYKGERTADGIVKAMRSKAGPSAKNLENKEAAEKYLSSPEHAVMGFFEKDTGEFAKVFKKLADALSEEHRFAYSLDSAINDKYGYKNQIVIFQPSILHNKFEDAQKVYEGDAKLSDLKKWVNNEVQGLAGHRTASNQDQFKKPLVVAYYDVDYVKNVKGTNYWRNRVMKVAKKIKDEGDKTVYFAIADKAEFSYEISEYGLQSDSDSPVIAATDSKGRKFPMKKEFSMDNLEEFVKDLLADKLEPYLKSETVPEHNDDPVKVVVAKNFDGIVNDETKDVLIEFYAPWCGHCKTLAPKYDELAEKLSKEEDIVIAKMDATANDVPQPYQVSGFPTLYFSPKGSKSDPKKYQGGREVEDFIKYLAKESTEPLKGWDRKGKKQKIEL